MLHTGGLREQRTFETEPFFCFHHVNAFEAANGSVIMDCLAMHSGVDFSINFGNLSSDFFKRAPWRTTLTRLTLDPARSDKVYCTWKKPVLQRCPYAVSSTRVQSGYFP